MWQFISYLVILLIITALLTFFSFSSKSVLTVVDGHPIDYSVQRIYNCRDARYIALSNEYLYLRNGSQAIIFENELNRSSYNVSHYYPASIAGWNRLLFVPGENSWNATVSAISFTNYSAPYNCSTASYETTGDAPHIISFESYVYMTCFELGFPIFDFSNITHPKYVGEVSLGNWHSIHSYIVSHYGLFFGDFSVGIFDLQSSPTNPKKLWEANTYNYYSFYYYTYSSYDYNDNSGYLNWVSGRFAVSERYFVINDYGNFLIIQHKNSSNCEYKGKISLPDMKEATHCAFLDNDVLLVAKENSIHLFWLKEKNSVTTSSTLLLRPLGEINLGLNGSIKDLIPIPENDGFYIADGSNGLLKLILNIESGLFTTTTTPSTSTSQSVSYISLFLVTVSIGIFIFICKYRHR